MFFLRHEASPEGAEDGAKGDDRPPQTLTEALRGRALGVEEAVSSLRSGDTDLSAFTRELGLKCRHRDEEEGQAWGEVSGNDSGQG